MLRRSPEERASRWIASSHDVDVTHLAERLSAMCEVERVAVTRRLMSLADVARAVCGDVEFRFDAAAAAIDAAVKQLSDSRPTPLTALAGMVRFGGFGNYALYYRGTNPLYARISGLDHPIYVGKADREVLGGGKGVSQRLFDHHRSTQEAAGLDPRDFSVRILLMGDGQAGLQRAVEERLITVFRPVWNCVLTGFGCRGDDPGTRANRLSAFDTVHPGRRWAVMNTNRRDDQEAERIRSAALAHLEATVRPPP